MIYNMGDQYLWGSKVTNLQSYLDKALQSVKFNDNDINDERFNYDIENEVREAIISIRTNLGMTQKQLADLTGISQANISKIENGNYHPSLMILKRIADGLRKRLSIEFID
jgi:DNA-binding XRE family transcriptional regulator